MENSWKRILTKRSIDKADFRPARYILWDGHIPGFGIRVSPNGKKVFILRYRARGITSPKRYLTIGPFGVLTVDEARQRATKLLAAILTGNICCSMRFARSYIGIRSRRKVSHRIYPA